MSVNIDLLLTLWFMSVIRILMREIFSFPSCMLKSFIITVVSKLTNQLSNDFCYQKLSVISMMMVKYSMLKILIPPIMEDQERLGHLSNLIVSTAPTHCLSTVWSNQHQRHFQVFEWIRLLEALLRRLFITVSIGVSNFPSVYCINFNWSLQCHYLSMKIE